MTGWQKLPPNLNRAMLCSLGQGDVLTFHTLHNIDVLKTNWQQFMIIFILNLIYRLIPLYLVPNLPVLSHCTGIQVGYSLAVYCVSPLMALFKNLFGP